MPKEKELKEKIIEILNTLNPYKRPEGYDELKEILAKKFLELFVQEKQKWVEEILPTPYVGKFNISSFQTGWNDCLKQIKQKLKKVGQK